MIKANGNGGMKLDKIQIFNFGIKFMVIIVGCLVAYFTTIGSIQTKQAVQGTKIETLEKSVEKMSGKVDAIYDKIVLESGD